jgi:hypothetical protein
MAFIVPHRSGTWEIRESRTTPAGPRSRTLASFRTLTPEVVERARARSSKPLNPHDLHRAAARVGAPIAASPSDRAAGELLAQLTAGRPPRPVLRRLLLDVLQDRRDRSFDSAQAAAAWIGATLPRRGEALRELLLLADRLPATRRPPQLGFPPIHSAPR